MPPAAFEVLEARGGMLFVGGKEKSWYRQSLDDLEFNVVCDHSRAHTLDDDSLTLETSSDPLADARAQPVMGMVYSGGARALK